MARSKCTDVLVTRNASVRMHLLMVEVRKAAKICQVCLKECKYSPNYVSVLWRVSLFVLNGGRCHRFRLPERMWSHTVQERYLKKSFMTVWLLSELYVPVSLVFVHTLYGCVIR